MRFDNGYLCLEEADLGGDRALGKPELLAPALQHLPELMGGAGNVLHGISPFLDKTTLSVFLYKCNLSIFLDILNKEVAGHAIAVVQDNAVKNSHGCTT
jgi:hypothetical protein